MRGDRKNTVLVEVDKLDDLKAAYLLDVRVFIQQLSISLNLRDAA